MNIPLPPSGYEAAHEEWLAQNPEDFRKRFRIGAPREFYATHYWKLVRQATLERDSFKCFRCGNHAAQVHHLHYDFMGEDHLHPEVLVSICRECHGAVEYGRNAEALVSVIRRRIYSCTGFVDGRKGFEDQTPVKVCSRLLEYRDRLAELRKLFAAKAHYRNPRIKSEAEAEAVVARFRQERQTYEEQALSLVSTWNGSEKEKAERLLCMLEVEIQNCRRFVTEVFEPVPPRPQGGWPTEALPESGSVAQGVESPVVGIKYHRGHVDGIAQGDSVRLVREPNNAYDPNAIQVILQTGGPLGYLTREFAAALVKQMDAGMCVQAQVSRIVRDKVYVAVIVGRAVA